MSSCSTFYTSKNHWLVNWIEISSQEGHKVQRLLFWDKEMSQKCQKQECSIMATKNNSTARCRRLGYHTLWSVIKRTSIYKELGRRGTLRSHIILGKEIEAMQIQNQQAHSVLVNSPLTLQILINGTYEKLIAVIPFISLSILE